MIPPKEVCDALTAKGLDAFIGVPDSLLKDFCAFVSGCGLHHVVAANEGNAVALAAGRYIGSGRPSMVYMQNSGIGNAVNPLLSLADPEVYGIPLMLMIGWRGEPGSKDEPQHVKQGKVTLELLKSMGVPYMVMDSATENVAEKVSALYDRMMERRGPVALVVRSGAFERCSCQHRFDDYPMSREEALQTVLDSVGPEDVTVCTTGKASRELYELREGRGEGHGNDFLTVGSMGHASSIALGIATARPERRVLCIDGDGSMLMHMGAMAVIGQSDAPLLTHVVINNGAHESVGGQPTVAHALDMPAIASACGYRRPARADTAADLADALASGADFVEVRVSPGSRADLGRPRGSPSDNMKKLMRTLEVR